MKCPNCGNKLVDIRTMSEVTDHLLCVECNREFSTVPDEEPESDSAEMAEDDMPVFLL